MLPRRGQGGFTLIEMLVVLTILGLVGALVLARGPGRSAALDMRAASSSVTGALRLARTRAISTNRSIMVRFVTAQRTVQVGEDTVRTLPQGIAMGVVTAVEQGAAIRFLPDGSSTGGRVVLTGEGRATQVGVDWLTGRVSVVAGS